MELEGGGGAGDAPVEVEDGGEIDGDCGGDEDEGFGEGVSLDVHVVFEGSHDLKGVIDTDTKEEDVPRGLDDLTIY